MTTVRQNITYFVLNSLILLAILPTTRTRTPSRATATRWYQFRKKSGATAPNRAIVPLDDVKMMHEGRATLGHAADIHANHVIPEEEEAAEISSENHPQYAKN